MKRMIGVLKEFEEDGKDKSMKKRVTVSASPKSLLSSITRHSIAKDH